MEKPTIIRNSQLLIVKSRDFNSIFDKNTGYTARWGARKEDDPQMCEFGPELLDVEISTTCRQMCASCYKSNTPRGEEMSLGTFKEILKRVPPHLQQIAFGIGDVDTNPDMFKIFEACREAGPIPNVTINGFRLTNEHVDKLAHVLGACAVSYYDEKTCFDAIRRLHRAGLKQINIHAVLSEDSLPRCEALLRRQKESPIEGLQAIVFLLMKPKGKRNKGIQLRSLEKYQKFIDFALDNQLKIGFDSCSQPAFIKAIQNREDFNSLAQLAEPCESGLFSCFCDVRGNVWPCSFCPDSLNFKPINLLEVDSLIQEVWMAPQIIQWREQLLKNDRKCPIFDLQMT